MKSPAINFYTSDFLTGTIFMNNEQKGAYVTLMCYQHQHGHLTEEQIFSVTKDEVVLSKFIKDKNGLFYNKRLDEEIAKKNNYSESRAKNRKGKTKEKSKENKKKNEITYENDMNNICSSYGKETHMENEIEIEIENNNINNINLLKYIEKEFGRTLSSIEMEYIIEQENSLGKEIVMLAIKECVFYNAKTFSYLRAILQNWYGKTLDEIKTMLNKTELKSKVQKIDIKRLSCDEIDRLREEGKINERGEWID